MKKMSRLLILAATCWACASIWSAVPTRAVTTLSNHGGPVMQSVAANIIFWLPANSHYVSPPLDNAPTDSAYESQIVAFFNNLSATSYLNIATQYPGQCSSTACTAPGNRGAISIANTIQDLNPYPHATLGDSDIQNEIKNQINQRGLAFNVNTEFFVFTAAGIQECQGLGGCSSTDFCAYHNASDFNGSTIIYAFMPAVDSLGSGCFEGVGQMPGRLVAADRELVALSHELVESITDPVTFTGAMNFPDLLPFGRTAWWDSTNVFGTNYGNEIGDECNAQGTLVNLNAAGSVFVQNQWSNDSLSCVSSFGPSLQFDVITGGDDLRGDSSATVALLSNGSTLQGMSLKAQDMGSWDNNSTHEVVHGLVPPSLPSVAAPLTALAFTLTSHSSGFETGDNWNIEHLSVKVLDPTGLQVCGLSVGGDPLSRLTGGNPTATFAMSNCPVTPSPPPAQTFTQIRFVITTGGDDLRGDSSATVALRDPGGATLQGITLKSQNQPSWDNNTLHDITVNLNSPQTMAAFGSLVLTLTSHNSGFETDDNWNVQVANITLQNAGGANATCFANASGNPFIRLTNSAPSVTISAGQGC